MAATTFKRRRAISSFVLALSGLLLTVAVIVMVTHITHIQGRRQALSQTPACGSVPTRECSANVRELRASHAAEDAVDVAIIQMVLSSAGLLILVLTLKATRDAVREAEAATSAAQAAVAISRDNAVRQVRAYVDVESISLHTSYGDDGAEIEIVLRNSGVTPARRVRLYYDVSVTEHLKQKAPVSFRGLKPTGHLVPASSRFPIALSLARGVFGQHHSGIGRGTAHVVIAGYISYVDVFGSLRRTSFTMYTNGAKNPDGGLKFWEALRSSRST